ncbi:CRISPR-associated Cse1 family protein [Prauserella shujinwangii]|uniref:CRISPR-associated Cse1 family protein n=1 Tax=Prauserella shujinwangii TaxID=1453103 RepID=A0A2T0LL20_9PSEU|nr:type I-E CRISPR-associated protein Cse1/CasA [Prauserella shujinwangii]PRX43584.1 CRISPR-associated Cse1 family protein [Prauserella shujinwangii]
MRFPLAEEPWLPVVDLRGHAFSVGFRELLTRAHELRWLDAEAPPVTAALHRLLIALLHRVLDGPAHHDEWARWWKEPALPADRIAAYLDEHAGELDLFDPRRPFLQCPALGQLAPRSAAQLVHFRSVGNNVTLFDKTIATDTLRLSPAEAARWLVTVQCYDPGGLKTPFTKTKHSQSALGNRFGMVLVEGNTLKETLLLNTCRYDPAADLPWRSADAAGGDRPAWEAEPDGPEPDERLPRGWLDLLTWPSRRVLLHPATDGTGLVDGAVITPGTTLKGELHNIELMVAFGRQPTRSARSTKEPPPWSPVRLHELRGVWRHARTMLLDEDQLVHHRPRALDEVAERVQEDVLSRHQVFTIRVFGQQLDDSGGGSVYAWLQEQLPAPAALLAARRPEVGPVLGSCVALADHLGNALTGLATACRRAFHAEHPPAAKRAAQRNVGPAQDYWPRLPSPFATLLLDLGTAEEAETTPKPPVRQWRDTVHRLATETADQLVAQLRERQGRHLYEISGAYERFERDVKARCQTFDNQIAGILP